MNLPIYIVRFNGKRICTFEIVEQPTTNGRPKVEAKVRRIGGQSSKIIWLAAMELAREISEQIAASWMLEDWQPFRIMSWHGFNVWEFTPVFRNKTQKVFTE